LSNAAPKLAPVSRARVPRAVDPLALATIGADEIFAPLPDREWLCARLRIEAGSRPTVIAGPPDAGKSMIAYSYAVASASGTAWCGVHPVAQARTLILDKEVGQSTRRKVQRFARAADVSRADLGDQLRIAIHPPITLEDANAERVLRATFKGFELVLLDSLTAFAGNLEEHTPALGKRLLMLGEIASDMTLAIVLLHHTNAAGGVRGSGAIRAGAENIWIMGESDGGRSTMSHFRSPDGEHQPDLHTEIVDVEVGGDRKAGLAVRLRDDEATRVEGIDDRADLLRDLTALLRTAGPLGGIDTIAKTMGRQAKAVRDCMRWLIDQKIAIQTGKGSATRHALRSPK
jgi:hypothetical protein